MAKVIFTFLVLLLIGLFFLGSFVFGIHQPAQPGANTMQPLLFSVTEGESVATISAHLEEQHLIRDPFYFRIYARVKDVDETLKAGKYEFLPSITIADIVDRLVRGETISNERTITIVEGWTREQIALYLDEQDIAEASEFLESAESAPIDRYVFLLDKPKKRFAGRIPVSRYLQDIQKCHCTGYFAKNVGNF